MEHISDRQLCRELEHRAYQLHKVGTEQDKLRFADAMIEYFIESPHQGHPGFETFIQLRNKYRVLADIGLCIQLIMDDPENPKEIEYKGDAK